jgi:beta-galactosidase
VQTKDGRLEKDVLRDVYRRAGIATTDYQEGVYVDWRAGFWVAVNYSSRAAQLSLPPTAEILMGSNPLRPADVLIWK